MRLLVLCLLNAGCFSETQESDLRAHAGPVVGLSFAPDGKRFASAGADGKLKIWAAGSDAPIREIDADPKGLTAVAWSPCGRTIATAGSSGGVKVWDPAGGAPGRQLPGLDGAVIACLAFAPGGKELAAGDRSASRVARWTTDDWAAAPPFKIDGGRGVRSLAFSPDGKLLAAGLEGFVSLWDVASATQRRRLDAHSFLGTDSKPDPAGVCFSPDGREIASAGSGHAALAWDAETGAATRLLAGAAGDVLALVYAASGTGLYVADAGGQVRRRRLDSSSLPSPVLYARPKPVRCLAVSGALLISGCDDGTIRTRPNSD